MKSLSLPTIALLAGSLIFGMSPVLAKPPEINPCALISKAEAVSVLGEIKGEPKADIGLLNEKECRYETVQGQNLVVRIHGADRWGLKKGEVSEMKPAAIAGLGDEAFSVQRGTTCEIYVRKGEVIVEVNATMSRDVAQKFAALIVSRLK